MALVTPAPRSAAQEAAGPSCQAECRGLGYEKVKAGEEHCGLVPREKKDRALDAACALAETYREELQARAEEQAREQCGEAAGHESCRCEGELRRWENVYTHLLSQRCWAECGWAYLLTCGPAEPGELDEEAPMEHDPATAMVRAQPLRPSPGGGSREAKGGRLPDRH